MLQIKPEFSNNFVKKKFKVYSLVTFQISELQTHPAKLVEIILYLSPKPEKQYLYFGYLWRKTFVFVPLSTGIKFIGSLCV